MVDIQTPSSFIPKKQESAGAFASHRGGFFSFLGKLLFTVAIIASVGVFVYEKYLEGQIAKMETDLSAARAALQPELIKELSRSDKRLRAAEELIGNHTILSAFFELLQSLTLQTVRFNSFALETAQNGQITITLDGEAVSYATVAYQAQVINQNPNFVNPRFSDLDLNDQGDVTFTFESGIRPQAVSYVEQLRTSGPLEASSSPQVSPDAVLPSVPEAPTASSSAPQPTQPN